MLTHLIGVARERGYRRASLETGSMAGFAPARSPYASAGFSQCGPFAGYPDTEFSTFMTLGL
jgi:putative acetyltransferase